MILSIVANRDAFLARLSNVVSCNEDVPDVTAYQESTVGAFPRRIYIPHVLLNLYLQHATWTILLANPESLPVSHCRMLIHDGDESHYVHVILSDTVVTNELADSDLFQFVGRKLDTHGVDVPNEYRVQSEIFQEEIAIRRRHGMDGHAITPNMFREAARAVKLWSNGDVMAVQTKAGPEIRTFVVLQHPRARAISWATMQIKNGYGHQVHSALVNSTLTGVQSVTEIHGRNDVVVYCKRDGALPFGSVHQIVGVTDGVVSIRNPGSGAVLTLPKVDFGLIAAGHA